EPQALPDRLVGETVGERVEDVELALGQLDPPCVGVDQYGLVHRSEEGRLECLAKSRRQVAWVDSLRDEGRGRSAKRCIDQLRLFMCREDHNLRGAFRRTQRADDVEPVELWQVEVQEDEVRSEE